jgi:hypothetical protein
VQIVVACPPMLISEVNRKLRRTAAEPMRVSLEDGTVYDDVTIPPTYVHKLHALYWMVDACTGLNAAGTAEVDLPQEATVFRLADFTMVALSIVAKVRVAAKSGAVLTGTVTFPDCKLDLKTMTAEAVTATGEVN